MPRALRLLALVPLLAWPSLVAAAEPGPEVRVFKTATCGCCVAWVEHLEAAGFRVRAEDVADLAEVKRRHGVPAKLQACHTAVVEGYVVEGHVPASDVKRLLAERPPVAGIAVPGMPHGSPGMESPTPEPYAVIGFDGDGPAGVFARHPAAPPTPAGP